MLAEKINYNSVAWNLWVIKVHKYNEVLNYLKMFVPEVTDVYYPIIEREFLNNKKGVYLKKLPLFAGYIFLKYSLQDDVHSKLRKNPFITTYIGTCSDSDILKIEQIRERENRKEFVSKRKFSIGDEVSIVFGQFASLEGTIIKMLDNNKMIVKVSVFNRYIEILCKDSDVIEKGGLIYG